MASRWNLWVWLPCICMVSVCCCKEVYRYPHNNTLLLFPSPLVLALFWQQLPTSSFIFKMFFRSLRRRRRIRSRNGDFFTSRGAHLNSAIMAMLYTHSIGNQPLNTMVVFKMRDSVLSPRYSAICNILRQWKTSLIPTYRVYRL